jgi:hypothetical protein
MSLIALYYVYSIELQTLGLWVWWDFLFVFGNILMTSCLGVMFAIIFFNWPICWAKQILRYSKQRCQHSRTKHSFRRLGVMFFNATFNNISVISRRSVLLVEKTRVPRENHQPVTSHWQTLSHNVALSTPLLSGARTHNISYGFSIFTDLSVLKWS